MSSAFSLELLVNADSEIFLYSVRGYEALSQLFKFELEIDALGRRLELNDWLHKSIAFRMQKRIVQASVTHFTDLGSGYYQLQLMPSLVSLNKQAQSHIYQNMSVVEIVSSLLQGFQFEMRLHKTYRLRDYCVQYQETVWCFIERLLAEEGIRYYFEFSAEQHWLVLSDQPSLQHYESLLYHSSEREDGYLLDWREEYRLVPTVLTTIDHNTEFPSEALSLRQNLSVMTEWGEFEYQFYPGGFKSFIDAENRLSHQRSNLQQQSQFISACSRYVELHLDLLVNLYGDETKDYLITELWHEAHDLSYRNRHKPQAPSYVNRFIAIPSSIFKSAIPSKTLIEGVQQAIVEAQSKAAPATHEQAEILVSFAWDKAQRPIPARVAQWWAGDGFGTQFFPRVGDAVWVCFVNGDPERPIIMGGSYDDERPPLYDLSIQGIRTGHAEAINELRFADHEQHTLSWQAARDFKTESGGDTRISAQRLTVQVAEGAADMQAQETYEINAHDFIELRVGKSRIKLSAEKVILAAPRIRLN